MTAKKGEQHETLKNNRVATQNAGVGNVLRLILLCAFMAVYVSRVRLSKRVFVHV